MFSRCFVVLLIVLHSWASVVSIAGADTNLCVPADNERTFHAQGSLYYEFWRDTIHLDNPLRPNVVHTVSYEFPPGCDIELTEIQYRLKGACNVRLVLTRAESSQSSWGAWSPVSVSRHDHVEYQSLLFSIRSIDQYFKVRFEFSAAGLCDVSRLADVNTLNTLIIRDNNECLSSPCRTGGTRRQCCNATGHCRLCGPIPDSSLTYCVDTFGSYQCRCVPGYRLNPATSRCEDVNECSSANGHSCQANAQCSNNIGSYTCRCTSGYREAPRRHCTDINECKLPATLQCGLLRNPSHRICRNSPGSFQCPCRIGYQGPTCSDIDECASGGALCRSLSRDGDARRQCVNTAGSYSCPCSKGYTGSKCKDENECSAGTHSCDSMAAYPVNRQCVNTNGSYLCPCLVGYTGEHCTAIPATVMTVDTPAPTQHEVLSGLTSSTSPSIPVFAIAVPVSVFALAVVFLTIVIIILRRRNRRGLPIFDTLTRRQPETDRDIPMEKRHKAHHKRLSLPEIPREEPAQVPPRRSTFAGATQSTSGHSYEQVMTSCVADHFKQDHNNKELCGEVLLQCMSSAGDSQSDVELRKGPDYSYIDETGPLSPNDNYIDMPPSVQEIERNEHTTGQPCHASSEDAKVIHYPRVNLTENPVNLQPTKPSPSAPEAVQLHPLDLTHNLSYTTVILPPIETPHKGNHFVDNPCYANPMPVVHEVDVRDTNSDTTSAHLGLRMNPSYSLPDLVAAGPSETHSRSSYEDMTVTAAIRDGRIPSITLPSCHQMLAPASYANTAKAETSSAHSYVSLAEGLSANHCSAGSHTYDRIPTPSRSEDAVSADEEEGRYVIPSPKPYNVSDHHLLPSSASIERAVDEGVGAPVCHTSEAEANVPDICTPVDTPVSTNDDRISS
eukprot:scpid21104/ scgid5476/ Fibrillin-2